MASIGRRYAPSICKCKWAILPERVKIIELESESDIFMQKRKKSELIPLNGP